MQYETLPDGSQIPVLGLGTWQMGGGSQPDYSRDDETVQIIVQAVEMGYTHIDTAEAYGRNHCEELVGRAMKEFNRDELFITTKISPEHLHYEDVHKAIQGSLKRLDTDYVDLYLIHWPNDKIPLEETFRALNEIMADGRVRRVGVSNFSVSQMRHSMELCETPLATNQVRYNLLDREPVRSGLLEFCQRNDIPLTAYSPLKSGVLEHPIVQEIAQRHDCTPGQVALYWLTRQPRVITIPMSQNLDHLRQNMEALSLDLSADEITELDGIQE
jgi:diketogulonate reductase-like aldo/keto reductase